MQISILSFKFWDEMWHGYFFVRFTLTSYFSKHTHTYIYYRLSVIYSHTYRTCTVSKQRVRLRVCSGNTLHTGCGHKVLNEVYAEDAWHKISLQQLLSNRPFQIHSHDAQDNLRITSWAANTHGTCELHTSQRMQMNDSGDVSCPSAVNNEWWNTFKQTMCSISYDYECFCKHENKYMTHWCIYSLHQQNEIKSTWDPNS